jgi:hypothetical protein
MKLVVRRVTLLGKKKQTQKGFLGGGTPLPESAPVDSHVLMRHIYRIYCVLFYVICLVVVMYLCLLFVYL